MIRRPAVHLPLVLVLLSAACAPGDEEPAVPDREVLTEWSPVAPGGEGFCAEALAGVDAFMAERAAAWSPPADDPRYGGTVAVGGTQELIDGMNVFRFTDQLSNQFHQFVNLMTLIELDEAQNPRPWLAESWEVSEDGTELVFRLRDDVYWHDGERTDAHDVAFTFRRVTDPETAFPNAAFWDLYDRGETGVEVVDSLTVRFRLDPHAGFLDPWRTTAIMPEHLLGEVPPAELAGHPFGTACPVGNGPFVFREHRVDEQWTFQANPAFPEELGGRPFVDRLVYRVIPEQSTLLTELLTGRLDVMLNVPPDQAERVVASETAELRDFSYRDVVFIAWNGRRPPLDEPSVRRALTLGIDREELVAALLQGYGVLANGTVPPHHWAADETLAGVDAHDAAEAGRLLEEAGWVDRDGDGVRENGAGEPLELGLVYNVGNRQREEIAGIVQAQLAEVGVRIVPEVLEIPALVSRVMDPAVRDFDGLILGWVSEFKLDDRDLFSSTRQDQPYAFAGLDNARIDELLELLQRTPDRDEALPLWREYQTLLQAQHPYTFLFFPERIHGLSTELQDVVMDARGDFVNLRSWWLGPTE